jgi:DHA1 family bicyclomycin/chloramphenicol resistance-like MFS transporter
LQNLKVILSTNTPRSKLKYFQLILILGSLTALGPFSIDVFTWFSGIAEDLNTTVAKYP